MNVLRLVGPVLVLGLLAAAPSTPPTFHGEISEILNQNCVGCHSQGGIAPFPLNDARWAKNMAPAIADSVKAGRMPPWPPGQGTPPLKGERRLSEQAKQTLAAWAEAGAPLGEPGSSAAIAPPAPSLPKPDLYAQMSEPYTANGALQDDYRCFLLDLDFKNDSFFTGYQITPGDKQAVHHVVLFLAAPDQVGVAQARDRQEAGPGWTCFGGPGLNSQNPNSVPGIVGFWVPGTQGTQFPEGTGRLIRAGSRVIMQVHYNTAVGTNPDQTKLGLVMAPAGAAIKRLGGMTLAAPVEVKCPPDQSGEACTREAAMKKTELGWIADGIHLMCGTNVAQYQAREVGDGSRQAFSCTWNNNSDLMVYGTTAHMHLRGVEFKIELAPDTPQARTLFYIPNWNFQWQGEYWYQEPFLIKAGEKVRVTCSYDNSSSLPSPSGEVVKPRYMTWGEGTNDEMCLGALYGVRGQ
jgi:mono/diheme cytochrome c family protein